MEEISMARTQKQITDYHNRYNVEHYEQIRANSAKEKRRIDLLRYGAEKKGISYQAYIIEAVDRALEADGFRLEDLPE